MAEARRRREEQKQQIKVQADKQLETLSKTVATLKEVGWHKFDFALRRAENRFSWPKHILGTDNTAALTDVQRAELQTEADSDAADSLEAQQRLMHTKNAYNLILEKCESHEVADLLEDVPIGHARAAYDIIKKYFVSSTVGGTTATYGKFFTLAMATSQTNVIEFMALVNRTAKDLQSTGNDVNESMKKAVLLRGLLPEFKDIKLQIEGKPAHTWPQTVDDVHR
jgi:hypothetical protein